MHVRGIEIELRLGDEMLPETYRFIANVDCEKLDGIATILQAGASADFRVGDTIVPLTMVDVLTTASR